MSHADESVLHAMLDGELSPAEQVALEQHLESCEECGRRAAEARQLFAEADRLIASLDEPAEDAPPLILHPVEPPDPKDVGGAPENVILIPPEPEQPRPVARRPQRGGRLLWAAGVVMLLGGGLLAAQILGLGGEGDLRERFALAPVESVPTVSETELAPPPPAARTEPVTGETTDLAGRAAAGAPARETAGFAPADSSPTQVAVAESAVAEPAETPARAEADAEEPPAAAARRQVAAAPSAAEKARADSAAAELRAARRRAEELEAELAAERAAEAALAQRQAQAAERAETPSAASNLERRSGIYQRIGLDEAARFLGGPVHAIDGVGRPQFIGLANASDVPGATPDRPVVRVVYVDGSQRMILLDQQRVSLDAGGEADRDTTVLTSNGRAVARWVKGDVRLWLQSNMSQSEIRNLVRRVR